MRKPLFKAMAYIGGLAGSCCFKVSKRYPQFVHPINIPGSRQTNRDTGLSAFVLYGSERQFENKLCHLSGEATAIDRNRHIKSGIFQVETHSFPPGIS